MLVQKKCFVVEHHISTRTFTPFSFGWKMFQSHTISVSTVLPRIFVTTKRTLGGFAYVFLQLYIILSGIDTSCVHFITSHNMNSHSDGTLTPGSWGKTPPATICGRSAVSASGDMFSFPGSGTSGRWQTTLLQACGWETATLVAPETEKQRWAGVQITPQRFRDEPKVHSIFYTGHLIGPLHCFSEGASCLQQPNQTCSSVRAEHMRVLANFWDATCLPPAFSFR